MNDKVPDAIEPQQPDVDEGVTDEGGRKDDKGPDVDGGVTDEGGRKDDKGLDAIEPPQPDVDGDVTDEGGRKDDKGPDAIEPPQSDTKVTTVGASAPPLPPPPASDSEMGEDMAAAPLTVEELKKLWKEATTK